MLNRIVDNIRKRVSRVDPSDRASYSSLMWYYSAVKTLRASSRSATSSPVVEPGRMFLMNYSPKTKDDLDYYDVYPIIFVVDYTRNGILGINLHYLPLRERSQLLVALMNIGKSGTKDRLSLSYQLIKGFSRSAHARVCLKRYLIPHISDMVHIPEEDWITVSGLPVEGFKKKNKESVWSESLKKLS